MPVVSPMTDILELLARAHGYRDKPHQLYSHISAMADRWIDDEAARLDIQTIMDREYIRDRRPVIDLPYVALVDWCNDPHPLDPSQTGKWYPQIAMCKQEISSDTDWIEVVW